MTSFVLVHDAWHGAWCWDAVKTRLEGAEGAGEVSAVLTPELPGHGSRTGDERRNITVDDYVSTVMMAVQLHRLDDLVLVGHGLAASFLPQVALRLRETVRQVVFIAGLLPPEGRTPLQERPFIERCLAHVFNAREKGVWLPVPILRQRLGLASNEPPLQQVLPKLAPDPGRPWATPTVYGQFPGPIPTTYVLFLRDRFVTIQAQRGYAALFGDVERKEIDAGHEGILTHAAELADLLLRYA